MKILDLRMFEEDMIITAEAADYDAVKVGIPVRYEIRKGRYFLASYSGRSHVEIRPSEKDAALIRRYMERDSYAAAVVANDGESICIKAVLYRSVRRLDLTCIYTGKFVNRLRKKRELSDLKDISASLRHMAVLHTGKGDKDGCYVVGMRTEKRQAGNKMMPDAVIVCGSGNGYIFLDHIMVNSSSALVCTGISRAAPEGEYSYFLAEGALDFFDESESRRSFLSVSTLFGENGENGFGFSRIWRDYARSECIEHFKRILKCGSHSVHIQKLGRDNAVMFDDLKKCRKMLQIIDADKRSVSFALTLWSADPTGIMEQLRGFVRDGSDEALGAAIELMSSKNAEMRREVRVLDSFRYDRLAETGGIPVDLADEDNKHKYKYATLSALGDTKIFDRRNKARKRIELGKNPLPALSSILENTYEGCAASDVRERVEGVTEEVRREIFGANPPTPAQAEAVSIALNTPDIAIIQGPPGTGKTTVITAIIHRLNEISGDKDVLFARNLVSAFQHDAVTNAIERISNFGLPAIKIGEKSSDRAGEKKLINYRIWNWTLNQQKKIADKNPAVVNNSAAFNESYRAYLRSGNRLSSIISVLEAAEKALADIDSSGTETGRRVDRLLEKFRDQLREAELANSDDSVSRALAMLPESAVAYSDDGEGTVRYVISVLKTCGSRFDELIKYIGEFYEKPEDERDYPSLRERKADMIAAVKPKPIIFSRPQENMLVRKVLDEVKGLVETYRSTGENRENAILADYYEAIRNDYGYVKESILAYSAVSGATNQQSYAGEILSLKKSFNGAGGENDAGSDPIYENVIVDEAARSNPLDLMIPMSMAKERIILVGDHRQLPHMIDEELAREFAQDNSEVTTDTIEIERILKESLFQRLKDTLIELEKKDHIKRYIILDKQYRTHPVLGEFVSRTFYEKHDSKEHFSSPRGAEEFAHSLPGLENKAAVWMNVPISKGAEVERGSSAARPAEAKVLVEHLKKMMDSDGGSELTFGIITFYKGQVGEIKKALVNSGIARYVGKKKSDDIELLPKYGSKTIYKGGEPKIVERLRIGSVDAFQGMEFDVVYLSTVRCNSEKKFGFLRMENRLCVAMSRQKKILISVGDRDMFISKRGMKEVPQIGAFYELCREGAGEYGLVIESE